MNVNLVRAIDRCLGIPACFIASVGVWFADIFRPSRTKGAAINKILLIELSEMGSTVLAYPAMRYLLDRYPKSQLYFLIFEDNRFSVDLLNIMPRDHVFTISMKSARAFAQSTYDTLLNLREQKLDVVFDLELFSRFSALLAAFSGARIRVGFHGYHMEGLYRGNLMNFPVMYNPHQHMTQNFLSLVKSLEHPDERPLVKEIMTGPFQLPTHIPNENEKSALMQRLQSLCPATGKAEHLILLNPSAGTLLPIRAWPLEFYIELSKRILDRFDAVLIVSGLDDAAVFGRSIRAAVGKERCVSLAGETRVSELFALLSQCSLLITSDSGPAHFATLTRTPSIVFFGPETPILYAPLGDQAVCLFAGLSCSPCLSAYNHRKTSCRDPKCMPAISVDQAFEKVCEILTRP